MKVLVTGATGFVGQHVVPLLLEYGYEVTAVARNESRARGFAWFNHVRFIACDIHQPSGDPLKLFGQQDVVMHLAWPGLPNYKSLHHFEQELPAQYRFLKDLIESGLQTLVVAGTCFEYGMQSGSLSEGIAVRPSNPYGFAKDALRCQLEYLKAAHPFQLAWARLFYLYGEGQPESSLLPQLRRAAEGGDQLFNMSGGEQLRDYLPVAEAARHLVSLALAEKDIGVVNVCSGIPISVRKLVDGWIKENGWSIRLNLGHYPYPDYEPMAFWGDPQKLSSLIGKTT